LLWSCARRRWVGRVFRRAEQPAGQARDTGSSDGTRDRVAVRTESPALRELGRLSVAAGVAALARDPELRMIWSWR